MILNAFDRPRPRGFTLIEMTASVVLIVIALGLTAELIHAIAAQRRAIDRRLAALHEASNLLERLAAGGPDAWPAGPASPDRLSERARRLLPGGTAAVEVGELTEGLRRLSVVVAWQEAPNRPAAPVRLTTWVADVGEAEAETRP